MKFSFNPIAPNIFRIIFLWFAWKFTFRFGNKNGEKYKNVSLFIHTHTYIYLKTKHNKIGTNKNFVILDIHLKILVEFYTLWISRVLGTDLTLFEEGFHRLRAQPRWIFTLMTLFFIFFCISIFRFRRILCTL